MIPALDKSICGNWVSRFDSEIYETSKILPKFDYWAWNFAKQVKIIIFYGLSDAVGYEAICLQQFRGSACTPNHLTPDYPNKLTKNWKMSLSGSFNYTTLFVHGSSFFVQRFLTVYSGDEFDADTLHDSVK